jgi:hypothetical protein
MLRHPEIQEYYLNINKAIEEKLSTTASAPSLRKVRLSMEFTSPFKTPAKRRGGGGGCGGGGGGCGGLTPMGASSTSNTTSNLRRGGGGGVNHDDVIVGAACKNTTASRTGATPATATTHGTTNMGYDPTTTIGMRAMPSINEHDTDNDDDDGDSGDADHDNGDSNSNRGVLFPKFPRHLLDTVDPSETERLLSRMMEVR